MISLKGLGKVFNSGKNTFYALRNISLEIEAGQIFGIVGKVGAGKTTLARCINLLEQPTSGTIVIDNCLISALGAQGLRTARQKIGLLTKNPQLLKSRTVHQNIALPLELMGHKRQAIEHSVATLLTSLNLSDKTHLYPQQLNYSQQQKVAVARTLAQKPRILICDDAHLDLKTHHAFFQLLRELNEEEKVTILYLSEDFDALKSLCQKIAILHQGEIVEEGNLLDIFVNPTSQIAKEIIRNTTRQEMPSVLRRKLYSQPRENFNPILRMSFLDPKAKEPLIAHVIQQFSLTLHIVQAHLETIHSQTFGIMLSEIAGQKESIQNAIQFLETKGLYIEVLGYVPRAS